VFFLAVTSSEKESQTHDEAAHIAAGYLYWTTGDFRLNPEHPPLSKLLQSLPLVAVRPPFSPPADSWDRADEFAIGRYFLYRKGIPAERFLVLARLVTIAMSLVVTLSV